MTSMQKVEMSGKITQCFLHFSSDRLQGKCSPSVFGADLIMNGLFQWPLYLFQTVSVPAKQIISYSQEAANTGFCPKIGMGPFQELNQDILPFWGAFFLIAD